jgi:putative polyhydroxyalkanoate system protein
MMPMSKLHLHRDHQLGLDAARQVASEWTDQAQTQWSLICERTSTPEGDHVTFARKGLSGSLMVTSVHFTLDMELGFLLSAYKKRMHAEIEHHLDQLLGMRQAQG